MSCRASVPIGGRPTRRIVRNCSSDSSGMSEKSIFARATVRRAFLAARPPRADAADRFALASLPLCAGDHRNTIENRSSNPEEPWFFRPVAGVRGSQGSRVGEDSRGLVERDAVLDEIRHGLLRVPFEHVFSSYRIAAGAVRARCEATVWLPGDTRLPSARDGACRGRSVTSCASGSVSAPHFELALAPRRP